MQKQKKKTTEIESQGFIKSQIWIKKEILTFYTKIYEINVQKQQKTSQFLNWIKGK